MPDLATRAKRQDAERRIYYRMQGVTFELEQALKEASEARLEKGLIHSLRELWLDSQGIFAMLKGRVA